MYSHHPIRSQVAHDLTTEKFGKKRSATSESITSRALKGKKKGGRESICLLRMSRSRPREMAGNIPT